MEDFASITPMEEQFVYDSLDAYLADFPQAAEKLRSRYKDTPVMFVMALSWSPTDLPGGYWALSAHTWPYEHVIMVRDGGDWGLVRGFDNPDYRDGFMIGLSSQAPITAELLHDKGFTKILMR